MKQARQVELVEEVRKTLDGWISKWIVNDGNNKLLWNDKAPTPNQVIELAAQAQQVVAERERAKVLAEVEELLVEIKNRKFPRGERRWCIECASRISKELCTKLK